MCITLSWLVPAVLRGVVFIPLYYVYKQKALKYGLPILLVIFEVLPCLFAVVRISIIAKRQKVQHRNKSKGRANQTKDENQHRSTALRTILFVAFFFIFCYLFEVYNSTCKTPIFRVMQGRGSSSDDSEALSDCKLRRKSVCICLL